MQVLCINMPRASDRRVAMIKQFRRLGMAFEIFSATDWRNLDEADFPPVDAEARWRQGRRRQRDIASVTRRIRSEMTEAIQMLLPFIAERTSGRLTDMFYCRCILVFARSWRR